MAKARPEFTEAVYAEELPGIELSAPEALPQPPVSDPAASTELAPAAASSDAEVQHLLAVLEAATQGPDTALVIDLRNRLQALGYTA